MGKFESSSFFSKKIGQIKIDMKKIKKVNICMLQTICIYLLCSIIL